VEHNFEVVVETSWENAVWNMVRDEIGRIKKIRTDAQGFIKKSQARQKKEADKRATEHKQVLKIGDKVLLYRDTIETNWSSKLEPKWDGPYRVQNIKGTSIRLRKLDGTLLPNYIHRSRLKLYHDAQNPPIEEV
jgi:hypothetical protein